MATPDPPTPAASRDPRELQAVSARLLSLLEGDRHWIARELHDQIGQAVTAMKLSAHLAMDEDDAAQRRDDLHEIVRIADDTIERLRDLSARLRPPQLDALGLEAALRWQVDQLAQASATQLRLQIAPLARRADGDIELACFRIAQDALLQACAAGARHIELSLREDGDDLLLRIEADSRGLADDGAALGLMHERARGAGGHLQFDDDAGMRLCLRLPRQTSAGGA
ncbi:histidine kinase [Luteimonas cucumeris]|uniref:Histidine kinase n=1 Tax=Luteimonas cucumeris TaxID=985012 RepID=A0A562L5F8_9GAMM|nr:histidine kinase [Luteimonas cucumeris]TWI02825.1 histidine kinase [Luteimonas cucumeris]